MVVRGMAEASEELTAEGVAQVAEGAAEMLHATAEFLEAVADES